MALLEKQLVIKKSSIPKAGKGLFTRKFIPKGTRIVEYTGTITTWKEVNHDEGKNGYIYYVSRNLVIDASQHPEALARYANDAKGPGKVKGISNNSDYIIDNKKVYIESLKDIPAGNEILVDYGKEYWDVMKFNAKLDKENRKKEKVKKK